ncbi:hypothetical protein BSL82_01290 [Tardibacter chloracetimidivorans]|uniref:Uncharacterized protein n=1 Tax=Tardibacter chloracetimidivorans TaxID=1921510 RepID=A0A1L3ZR44_9SPHN|nr:phage tail tube protein [Tardibacter chloracetimidivorans]API58098.1 hypothetical protein BSL82_01290 [Tardibacter chloracetimidivorans]
MTDAQGLYKQLTYKKQSGKGTAASGSGGQLLRRETATFNLQKDTYSSNEITSHQQYTGDKHGIGRVSGTINGLLSGATYAEFMAAVLRRAFAATSSITSLSLTIAAGSGSSWTITRASGDFLTGGIKIGDVVRLAGGSLDPANVGKNLVVTGVTATVLTVLVMNESSLTAEGPIASCTVSVPGKKTLAPTSSHTNDYFTVEEWHSDLSRSHLYTDVQVGRIDVGLPATGNATMQLSLMGLARTKSGSQVLTTPTAETTSEILTAVNGIALFAGTRQLAITSANISIDGQMNFGEAVVGSNAISDMTKGDIKVSGSFTAVFQDDTISDYLDSENATSLVLILAENDDADAEFVTFSMSRVKVLTDDKDDGKKQIIQTFNFTAEINGAGGAALANDQTILTIQDSLVA